LRENTCSSEIEHAAGREHLRFLIVLRHCVIGTVSKAPIWDFCVATPGLYRRWRFASNG
jgi:hypothetical protein